MPTKAELVRGEVLRGEVACTGCGENLFAKENYREVRTVHHEVVA